MEGSDHSLIWCIIPVSVGQTEKNHKKTSVKIAILQAEISHFNNNNNNNNNNSILQFLFICVPTQQPKGQLESEHEWMKVNKHTQSTKKAK
jgi:hypothetical protein